MLPSSGKLDKKALPKYDSQDTNNGNSFEDAAITETEKKLLPFWRELLGAKHIDVQESFFDLGGWVYILHVHEFSQHEDNRLTVYQLIWRDALMSTVVIIPHHHYQV